MNRVQRLRAQSGFSLIELMVSLVIGLFIAIALVSLLINVNRNNSELSKTNRIIENGRFAVQMLTADLGHAGFWAGHVPKFDDLTNTAVPTDVPTGIPNPCVSLAIWGDPYKTNLLGIPVQAYEIPSPVPSPTLSVCATRVLNPQPNTDVLFVRHAETCIAGVDTNCPAQVVGDVYFQEALCTTTTSVNYTTTVSIIGTDTFTLKKRDCTTTADLYRFVSNMYYIRDYAVTAGDGIPTLMRSQWNGTSFPAAQAVVEGVEGFRVEIGVDNVSDSGAAANFTQAVIWANNANLNSPTNRGDGLPDGAYIRCTTAAPCTVAQLMNAVAVKVYLLVRSENKSPNFIDGKAYCLASSCPTAADKMGPFNDGYKRHLFMQTIRLTNVSSRRETP
ncbi:PilW family protein [Caenimonas aquaedulcis]|uniref:PilW family protein n=1 Tax=Caenimonas aquaedulcis TaxID=2793270 RepID=A0A931H2T6_9BURK|nr:PilW family protein [Caenimonas aquaedulcis]MBG9387508.1 PilW family protein [Caenimonas aquaedulcis]